MNQNYQFFMKANLNPYIGEWIAICNKKIVAHGKSVKEVYKKAKEEYPKNKLLVTKVPDKQTMIF